MKNFGAILFLLASAGSFVTGTPAFRSERRAVSAEPASIAARALELAPKVKVGSRSNDTENAVKSLVIPRGVNSTDENVAGSLVTRRNGNFSEVANEKRSPGLHQRRGNLMMRSSLNETDV
ncbi:hypothetical protein F5Y00DRAFT_265967 [Daldinia vernicosa]|uniref:uncharacterized protein n=1 Tax=Daldinia vernicosa TaxID=114800 RepID=UPI002007C900|nr:uncharacterized protein F5Y00DRAFT_265967 [Daldinia vernicosa]KAI0845002.1 hypothetical protein F5Y00DRAFT_265967 [Daldinia vernicosa]